MKTREGVTVGFMVATAIIVTIAYIAVMPSGLTFLVLGLVAAIIGPPSLAVCLAYFLQRYRRT
jgi:CDP-diglyceride synthetase